jgi:hypothetical protein
MPRKMVGSAPSTTARSDGGAGSRLHPGYQLQEGPKSENIHARSGVIRGVPIEMLPMGVNQRQLTTSPRVPFGRIIKGEP